MNEFSDEQLDYLQNEFDRQKEIIQDFGKRESDAISELEKIKQSFSYRIGRLITMPVRYIIGRGGKEVLTNDVPGETSFDPLPRIIVDPDLVPSRKEDSFSRALIQDLLSSMNNKVSNANEYRDFLKSSLRSLPIENVANAAWSVTNYVLLNAAYRPHKRHLFTGFMRFFILNNPGLAVEYYQEFGQNVNDNRARKEYVNALIKIGEIKKPLFELESFEDDIFKKEKISLLSPVVKLLEHGFSGEVYSDFENKGIAGNIMYCVSQARPFTTNGYAIRTHEIAKSIERSGRKIVVCARHGYPLDRSDFSGRMDNQEYKIDNIDYKFNSIANNSQIKYNHVFNLNKFEEYHDSYASTLIRQVKLYNPEIIHAASNFVVGMTAVNVARALGVPSVYEIRGFWHETQASKTEGYGNSDHYNLSESLEIEVAKRADHVLTITNSIAEILIGYGIDRQKISVLPNCVDSDRFAPDKRDIDLEDKHELYGKIVVGYVGSFVEYEGLDILLRALSTLKRSSRELVKVLLVGDGPEMKGLQSLAKELNLEEIVVFVGRVPHEEVSRYYSVIDITPFPRKGRRVCELVSPLKPFEAMAMGKCVIVSDVRALEEFIENGDNGLIHKKDDSSDLARCIEELVVDDELRGRLGVTARDWVVNNRTWDTAGKIVESVYSNLLMQR